MDKNFTSTFNKLLLVGLFITSSAAFSNAQVINTNTEDLIMQIEHFNYEKQVDDVNLKLSTFKGTSLVSYCKSLDVLMFRIDRNLQTDDTKMLQALKNAGYQFVIKENASIEKVQAACLDRKENSNNQKQ